ncbi:MAG: hypothetical protein FWE05_12580 [Defluviitaleaceae bacterium]|nr:hypothetical protein [Defluviitaleaceae bacterium]
MVSAVVKHRFKIIVVFFVSSLVVNFSFIFWKNIYIDTYVFSSVQCEGYVDAIEVLEFLGIRYRQFERETLIDVDTETYLTAVFISVRRRDLPLLVESNSSLDFVHIVRETLLQLDE